MNNTCTTLLDGSADALWGSFFGLKPENMPLLDPTSCGGAIVSPTMDPGMFTNISFTAPSSSFPATAAASTATRSRAPRARPAPVVIASTTAAAAAATAAPTTPPASPLVQVLPSPSPFPAGSSSAGFSFPSASAAAALAVTASGPLLVDAAPAADDDAALDADAAAYEPVRPGATYADLTPAQIAHMPLASLEALSRAAGITGDAWLAVKQERRRNKNRFSARQFSRARRVQSSTLEVENSALRRDVHALASENSALRSELAASAAAHRAEVARLSELLAGLCCRLGAGDADGALAVAAEAVAAGGFQPPSFSLAAAAAAAPMLVQA